MSSVLANAVTLLGAIWSLCTLLSVWVSREQQQALLNRTISFLSRVSEAGPIAIAQAPLRAMQLLCDAVLGSSVWSIAALRRVALVSIIFIFGGLGVTGLATGSLLAMGSPPWRDFESSMNAFVDYWPMPGHSLQKTLCFEPPPQCGASKDPFELIDVMSESPEARLQLRLMRGYVQTFRHAPWKWIYTFAVGIVVICITALMNAITFAISRGVLRIGLRRPGLGRMIAVLATNLCAAFLGGIVTALIIAFVSMPFTWALVFFAIWFSGTLPRIAAIIVNLTLLLLGVLLAFILAATWMRVIVLVAVVPAVALLIGVVLGPVLYVLGPPVNNLLLVSLRRAAVSEHGFFAFAAVVVMALEGLLAALLKLF